MYEIPQELKYREKIVFNLDFEQLIYALIFSFLIIIIFKTPLSFPAKIFFIVILVNFAISFMFFNFKDFLKSYISWLNLRNVKFMSSKLNNFFNLHDLKNDVLETRTYKNKLYSKINKKPFYNINKISIIKVNPINFNIKTNDEKEHIIKNFQKFLNSLDFNIQILVKTEPLNLNSYFDGMEKKVIKKYNEYFEHYKTNLINLIENNKIKNRSFYLIIKETTSLEIQTNIVLDKLKQLRLKSYILKKEEILTLLKEFFPKNIENISEIDVTKFNYLNYLVSPSNIKNSINYLEIDNRFYRIITAHGYPRSVQSGFLDKIITLKGNFDISLFIEPLNIEQTIVSINKELQKQRADLYSLKKKLILNTSLEIKYKDTRKILEQLQKGINKLFNISLYILITADSKQELDLLTKKVESELNSLLIIPKMPIFLQHKCLKSILPLATNELNFKRNITTEALSAFFPFTSKFLDIDNNGILLGLNKNNIPIIKDIYNLSNGNGFLLSSSGAGKSFYSKLYLIRRLLLGTKVYVIDPQAEYIKIAKKFKGQIITISKDSETIINPLDLMGHDYAEKRISLIDLFNVMLGGVSEIQKAVIDKALTSCYLKKEITSDEKTWNNKMPILEDLLKELYLMEKKATLIEKPTYHSLINRLSMYVNGVFSFLNKQTNINFKNNFIVFNIGEMPKQVKPVIMFLILDYVYMKMKYDKKQKLLIIDEAWSLLNKVEEASYIFEIVKTSRKFNLSLLLITQDVLDLIDSKAGNAILSNSSYTVLFSQKPAVIESVSKIFRLSLSEQDLLLTSSIGYGLIILDHEHSEIKVVSSKEEYDLITTNPNDLIVKKSKIKKVKVDNKIDLDTDKRFYIKKELSKEEVDYLIYNDYKISSHVGLDLGRRSEYLLKPYSNESSSHFFLVYVISEYIRKFTNEVYVYKSVKPDIVFKANNKEIAIEVETGKNVTKDLKEKVENLNKGYEEWFFVVDDKDIRYKYIKYGQVLVRNEVIYKINEYFVDKNKLYSSTRLKRFKPRIHKKNKPIPA